MRVFEWIFELVQLEEVFHWVKFPYYGCSSGCGVSVGIEKLFKSQGKCGEY